MPLSSTLRARERIRDASWRRHRVSPVTLGWRAATVRHSFHLLPGESVLEIGAGSGLWTEHFVRATRGENPVTAAVFNHELADAASRRDLANTEIVHLQGLDQLPLDRFDYIVGHGLFGHEDDDAVLAIAYRLLRPGGQLLAFEGNGSSPAILARSWLSRLSRRAGDEPHEHGIRRAELQARAVREGFTHIDILPSDILPAHTPPSVARTLDSTAVVLEHAPVVGALSRYVVVWLSKPGRPERPRVTVAPHRQLADAVSVVIPCHNEEMNVRPVADALRETYGPYIHEIIFVDDNSTDGTAAVVSEMSLADPRVRLVKRTPPNGVGRALRDGYAAATGRYILTMDCDFVVLVPELRDLFDAVAAGHDGAIGSRFSHDSVLVNYPFFKIVCNRAFHVLVRLMLARGVRDLSNNLKLYRADVLKSLPIESPHFAANLETGLRPLLAGYDVVEVPMSWINRTAGMGASSFRIVKVGPGYVSAFARILAERWRRKGNRAVHRLDEARGTVHRG